eukprot:10944161-Karenia_brevis.AAC.1
MSSSGKHPAGATGQPHVMCIHFYSKKCGGWSSLDGMATNCYCICGAPFALSRKTLMYWEGDESIG